MLFAILRSTTRCNKTTKYFCEILHELRSSPGHIKNMEQDTRNFSGSLQYQPDVQPATPSTKAVKANQQQLRREKQQLAAKKKTVPYAPGTVSLQVLGPGANGSPSAVYLFTDQSRYLFNCGEGTQRLAHEHKTKLTRLEQIFVTRNTWTTVGGFPGLALTVQDAGVKELVLHGPPRLDNILHSMKRFVVLKALKVETRNCTQVHKFEDQVMTVKCIPLYKTEKLLSNATDSVGNAKENVVIAYICTLKPRAGALSLEKCVERGVPPGPLLGLLKNGIDVTLDNGTLVKSKDVSEPGEAALTFVFIDIPTEEFLPALQENAKLFHKSQDSQETSKHEVALVVHFSPEDLTKNNCYKDFMQKFSANTQHIYLNKHQNSFSGYIAAHRIQYQLNQLNEAVFPLLGESEYLCNILSNKLKKTKLEDEENQENSSQATQKQPNEEVEKVHSLTTYHMRPRKGFDRTQEAKLNPNEYLQETQVLPDFPERLQKLKESMLLNATHSRTFPKVTFLGTGSCIPNKTRNVSAILLQPSESSYMILDCGEGTLGQIIRFFGKTKAEEVIRQLKAIYVSHLHADHHIGLIGLLNERQRLLGDEHEKLLLFAPKQIQPWLNFYNEYIQHIDNAYELIGNAELLQEPYTTELGDDTGVLSVSTCMVRHCPHSFGVSLTLNAKYNAQPIKITYSGDTMPCQDLIDLGKNSTILIHEATMEDDLVEEAKIKMHSTISQAIAQGREMHAQHIILTHFSQRYAKLPRMQQMGSEEAEAEAMKNVAIAFDNMQVSLEDLQQFHILYPPLKALFAEHAEELEQKALKRELKLERKRKLLNVD